MNKLHVLRCSLSFFLPDHSKHELLEELCWELMSSMMSFMFGQMTITFLAEAFLFVCLFVDLAALIMLESNKAHTSYFQRCIKY